MTTVIWENNKKIVVHEHLDEDEIIFRKNIETFLEQTIGKDEFNLGKIIDYNIFTEWVSSVVAKITTESHKEYVFKSCNDSIIWWESKIHIEAKVFDIRRKYWIKTPIVYQESIKKFNGRKIPYIIMEYIQATKKFTEKNEQEIAYEIGENIAKISKLGGKWFGWIKKIEKNIPIWTYDTIEKYYTTVEKRIKKSLTEKNIIGKKEWIKLDKAIQIIKDTMHAWTKAALNHEDVRFDNIFLTNPITIFDPSLRLDHPLMDLATTEYYLRMKSIIPWDRKKNWGKKLWEWYEHITKEKINKNTFNACLVLKIIQKMDILYKYPEWSKRIQKALEQLDKIKL